MNLKATYSIHKSYDPGYGLNKVQDLLYPYTELTNGVANPFPLQIQMTHTKKREKLHR